MPPYGVLFQDFLEAQGEASLLEFLALCPGPALLEATRSTREISGFFPRATGARRKSFLETRIRGLLTSPELADAKIHFLAPPQAGGPVTVGRCRRLSDVGLSDQSTSRRHAKFFHEPPWWRVLDLESRRGTTIEGRRVASGVPTPILDGQLLGLGDCRVVFLTSETVYALGRRWRARRSSPLRAGIPPCGIQLGDLVSIMSQVPRDEMLDWGLPPFLLKVPTEPLQAESGRVDADRTLACSTKTIRGLRRTRAVGATLIHSLTPRTDSHSILIGRAHGECDVVLPERSVSKHHAKLNCAKGVWRVLDLESRNGTFLDGKRLRSGIMTPIHPGAALWFSCYRAMFLMPTQVHDLTQSLGKRAKNKPAA